MILSTIRNEFRKNKHVTDKKVIEEMQADAARALSNFLVADSLAKHRKRSGVKGDVMDGSQIEHKEVEFNVKDVEKKIKETFEAYDKAEAAPSVSSRTDALDWALEDYEDEAPQSDLVVESQEFAKTIASFSGAFRERDPNLGFDMQYFQFSDQEIEPSEAPVVESTEAQDQAR